MKTLQDILKQRDLFALFQPITDFSSGTFLGYEGLIRGPADNPLHSPINLFGAAKQQCLTLEIEMLCRQIVLESFALQNLPGHLFLNVSPETLTHPSFKNGQTLSYLENLGIDPKLVIIEITENQPTFDFDGMRNALLHYRSMGFQIAIDDLGEGFSSLRLWSELRPEFVKVDMHFVQGVNSDPLKQQFLRSIQSIALSSGTQVIAEGIETAAEFRTIRDIGIACGQGYFIARPNRIPPLNPSAEVGCLINANLPAEQHDSNAHSITVETILRYVEPAQPETAIEKIFTNFSEDKNLRAIPVVKNGRPVGLINRYEFVDSFAQPYRRELLGKKPCADMMNATPLLVEKSTPIHELSGFLSESEIRHFTDGFIITEQGRYIGVGTGQDLLREITKAQIKTARYANPLTLLPGNVPINEHIELLLQSEKSFAVCYGDLDNFKPFNDVCGYRKGDELIQFTARLLGNFCDPIYDFIGHIGGDDFILVLQSPDWEHRCNRALSAFAHTSPALFDKDHRSIGGYLSGDRQGRIVHHPLPTLSIGVIWVNPELFSSHHEVAEAATVAKKMAKENPGNSLFIERRRLHQHQVAEEQHESERVYYG
jgi:EAL domain-containing protein (putative c-di-GMP-specific phosphodiesterase class I)/GGDEF domain-containing protein